ncbi:MAG: adenylyltransferase/cytidyltransferase family protein [Candidatus Methanospirareceae archaeon]
MVRVLATGTFEILHPGHLLFLEEAKKLGDELFVIVGRDANVRKRKRTPIIPEEQRLQMVSALKMVDKAMLGSEKDIYEPLYSIRPDIIALGYDQAFDEEELERELRARGFHSKVVRIKKHNSNAFCKAEEIIKRILKSVEEGRWGKSAD